MVSGALIDGFDPVEGASFPLFPNQAENERLWDVFGETFEDSELLHLTSTTKGKKSKNIKISENFKKLFFSQKSCFQKFQKILFL